MAASSAAGGAGPSGSRKGIQGIPYLTSKSIIPIGYILYSDNPISSDRFKQASDAGIVLAEAAFLTGMLLCKLWEENLERLIGENWYDLNFASHRDDPISCIKLFLSTNGIEADISDVMEKLFQKGYISRTPPPLQRGIFPQSLITYAGSGTPPEGIEDEDLLVLDAYVNIYEDVQKLGEFSWTLLLFSLARELEDLLRSTDQYHIPLSFDVHLQTKSHGHLEEMVQKMIKDRFIRFYE